MLIKPQFEAGREKVGKKGVVRDPAVHEEVICKIVDFAEPLGLQVIGLTYSPVKGPEGNIEYLINVIKPEGEAAVYPRENIKEIVRLAHEELDK